MGLTRRNNIGSFRFLMYEVGSQNISIEALRSRVSQRPRRTDLGKMILLRIVEKVIFQCAADRFEITFSESQLESLDDLLKV
mmetsp:Transcript_30998/g.71430  ORF Transcript_30998/g.71430 Transcript_30998/m.71430 type:complete len:82 (+) Transcript_30998:366-611(+)